jgi:hypothetical protein
MIKLGSSAIASVLIFIHLWHSSSPPSLDETHSAAISMVAAFSFWVAADKLASC